MVPDSSAENTPNAPEFVCPIPKVLEFNEKRLHLASVVCAIKIIHPIQLYLETVLKYPHFVFFLLD